MKILLLNGAPRSGKDTVSQMLKDSASSSIHQEKFARPMKIAVPLIYGISREQWENELDTARNKDLACSQFFGKTPREVQIALSEDYLKPMHGKSVFGELLARRISGLKDRSFLETVIVSDSGFYHEAKELIDVFGANNIQLWRIHREGCNFSKDSRNHIDLKDDGVVCYDVNNNGSMDDLRCLVLPLYKAFTLPRRNMGGELEDALGWHERQRTAAKAAFEDWPIRKIDLIRKEANAA